MGQNSNKVLPLFALAFALLGVGCLREATSSSGEPVSSRRQGDRLNSLPAVQGPFDTSIAGPVPPIAYLKTFAIEAANQRVAAIGLPGAALPNVEVRIVNTANGDEVMTMSNDTGAFSGMLAGHVGDKLSLTQRWGGRESDPVFITVGQFWPFQRDANQVHATARLGSGSTWLVATEGGVFRFPNFPNGPVEHVPWITVTNGLTTNVVTAVASDAAGEKIYVGTTKGLFLCTTEPTCRSIGLEGSDIKPSVVALVSTSSGLYVGIDLHPFAMEPVPVSSALWLLKTDTTLSPVISYPGSRANQLRYDAASGDLFVAGDVGVQRYRAGNFERIFPDFVAGQRNWDIAAGKVVILNTSGEIWIEGEESPRSIASGIDEIATTQSGEIYVADERIHLDSYTGSPDGDVETEIRRLNRSTGVLDFVKDIVTPKDHPVLGFWSTEDDALVISADHFGLRGVVTSNSSREEFGWKVSGIFYNAISDLKLLPDGTPVVASCDVSVSSCALTLISSSGPIQLGEFPAYNAHLSVLSNQKFLAASDRPPMAVCNPIGPVGLGSPGLGGSFASLSQSLEVDWKKNCAQFDTSFKVIHEYVRILDNPSPVWNHSIFNQNMSDGTTAMTNDGMEHVWIATPMGLHTFVNGQPTEERSFADLLGADVLHTPQIAFDSRGRLWLSGRTGDAVNPSYGLWVFGGIL